jgi:predicted component of type VI protein secretion system
VDPALLGLKVAFLVLLYLFIWRVVKAASRDLSIPQESFVFAPAQARAHVADGQAQAHRLVVVASPTIEPGSTIEAGPVPITFGRSDDNRAVLDSDDFVSGHHARIESTRDGVWLVDLDSTNGTWVNDERMSGRVRLQDGDIVRIGRTELRFER